MKSPALFTFQDAIFALTMDPTSDVVFTMSVCLFVCLLLLYRSQFLMDLNDTIHKNHPWHMEEPCYFFTLEVKVKRVNECKSHIFLYI